MGQTVPVFQEALHPKDEVVTEILEVFAPRRPSF
jgi:hypothetical protein